MYPGGFYGADYGIVAAQPAVYIVTTALPPATSGVPYLQTVAASGGRTPYTFSLAGGALPLGLVLSATGVISGTAVAAPPTITPTILRPGRVDRTYVQTMTVSGPAFTFDAQVRDADGFTDLQTYDLVVVSWVDPILFDKEAVLPRCLRVVPDGRVAGIPMRVGVFTFTLRAFDATGQLITSTHSLTVTP